jgi:Flp pilus assembly protein TadD
VAASMQYLSAKPDDLDVLKVRALSYMQLNNYDMAVRDFSALISHEPKIAEWYSQRSACYKKLGEDAASIRDKAMADDLQSSRKSF